MRKVLFSPIAFVFRTERRVAVALTIVLTTAGILIGIGLIDQQARHKFAPMALGIGAGGLLGFFCSLLAGLVLEERVRSKHVDGTENSFLTTAPPNRYLNVLERRVTARAPNRLLLVCRVSPCWWYRDERAWGGPSVLEKTNVINFYNTRAALTKVRAFILRQKEVLKSRTRRDGQRFEEAHQPTAAMPAPVTNRWATIEDLERIMQRETPPLADCLICEDDSALGYDFGRRILFMNELGDYAPTAEILSSIDVRYSASAPAPDGRPVFYSTFQDLYDNVKTYYDGLSPWRKALFKVRRPWL